MPPAGWAGGFPEARVAGVISDTHGLVRPEALAALEGADVIVHAGDVGGPEVLEALEEIAPVVAVRGNTDRSPWAYGLPDRRLFRLGPLRCLLLHEWTGREPVPEGCGLVVFGHSHSPAVYSRAGVLFLNPGSAGPRRFRLPVCLARLRLADEFPRAEIVHLG